MPEQGDSTLMSKPDTETVSGWSELFRGRNAGACHWPDFGNVGDRHAGGAGDWRRLR